MNTNYYETPKSSVDSYDVIKPNKFNTLIIWATGLSLIALNSFSFVFSILFITGAITPDAEFVAPSTINLIDRTIVSLLYIFSGALLLMRKKQVVYVLLASIISTLIIKIILVTQADIQQYIKSAGVISIVTMGFIFLYSVYLRKKRIIN